MNGFANAILTLLLSWMRVLVNDLWRLLSSEDAGLFYRFLAANWKVIVLILCAGGFVIDRIIYLIRWRPYYVWSSRLGRLKRARAARHGDVYPEEDAIPPEEEPSSSPDGQEVPFPDDSASYAPDAFDQAYPISELDAVLPQTKILVMALPAVADTVGILSRERIALLPREAIVVNVGRGSAIDQDALMEALNAGRIAGAALDVMVPEPLPKDHPLWSTRNLLLTPHISGNMSLGYTCDRNLDMFCRDLDNYAASRPLEHRVDRKRGY